MSKPNEYAQTQAPGKEPTLLLLVAMVRLNLPFSRPFLMPLFSVIPKKGTTLDICSRICIYSFILLLNYPFKGTSSSSMFWTIWIKPRLATHCGFSNTSILVSFKKKVIKRRKKSTKTIINHTSRVNVYMATWKLIQNEPNTKLSNSKKWFQKWTYLSINDENLLSEQNWMNKSFLKRKFKKK